jgi:hypothetical protein
MVRAFLIAGAVMLVASVSSAQACRGRVYSGCYSGPCVTQTYYYAAPCAGNYSYAGPSCPAPACSNYVSPPCGNYYYATPSYYSTPQVYYGWSGHGHRHWRR